MNQAARIVPSFQPGRALRAQDLNALAALSAPAAVGSQQVLTSGVPYASIHVLQGTANFPSANGNFGYDVFLGESYEIAGYYLVYSGSGSFTVQMMIGGELVGPVISQANASSVTVIDEPRPIYGDNDTFTVKVLTVSGTITGFALVLRCWRRA